MKLQAQIVTVAVLALSLAGRSSTQAATPVGEPASSASIPSAVGIKKIIPRGMLLNKPAKQPTCSKLPTSYELGSCFQLDDSHCLLVASIDEQGGPDLCVGNDAFVFNKLSDIKPENAVIVNRAEDFVNTKTETKCFLAKYPVSGFVVPLGAKLENGQHHPAAGTGVLMSVCVAFAPDRSDPLGVGKGAYSRKAKESFIELIPVRWDGKTLELGETQIVQELFGHPLLSKTFGSLAPVGESFVGPFEFKDVGVRSVRFDWDGNAWKAAELGGSFTKTDHEMESSIQKQGDRYLISTRDDQEPKVRIYSSDDGINYSLLFEAKNHTVPRSLNLGLDGGIYLATNPGPGFLRNPLLAYPLVGNSFGEPITIHDQDGVRSDKGEKIPFVDHGLGVNVRLEGRPQHLIFYRVCDLRERTLYGFQSEAKKQLHGDGGPIPKRPTSGVYAAELVYDAAP